VKPQAVPKYDEEKQRRIESDVGGA
jgi:hypothetical protein